MIAVRRKNAPPHGGNPAALGQLKPSKAVKTTLFLILGLLALSMLVDIALHEGRLSTSNPSPQARTAYDDGIVVERRVAMPWLPSASGMAALEKDRWIVAGDDASHLFIVDDAGQLVARMPLPYQKHADATGRMPKSTKRDYEAIAAWNIGSEQHFLVFGSGSKVPQRTFVVWGIWENGKASFHEYESSALYQQILLQADIMPESLNVEGAVIMGERLVLLNREDNLIFSIDLDEFIQFIQNQSLPLEIDIAQVGLPEFAGVVSGMSGACTDSTGNRLFFCASVEDRSDTQLDGQILGSSIGWVDLGDSTALNVLETYHLVDAKGNRTFDKLEAIEILSQDAEGMRLVGVTDSDDGGSEWLQIFIPHRYLPQRPASPFARKP